MGLFSSETVVNVSSSVYNLAGEQQDRPIFLKNLIIRNVLSGTKVSLGTSINSGYLNGPGIKFRSFFRWAVDNYSLIGLPTGNMYAGDIISTSVVQTYIPVSGTEVAWVQEAYLGDSNYLEWAKQWMLENYPEELDTEWEADFDDATKTVHITRENDSEYDFVASDFESGAKYIFALYTIAVKNTDDPVVEGSVIPLTPYDFNNSKYDFNDPKYNFNNSEYNFNNPEYDFNNSENNPFPSVTGYTLVSIDTVDRTETLTTTVEAESTYSDARPPTSSTSTTTEDVDVEEVTTIYDKKIHINNSPDDDAKISDKYIRNLYENKTIDTVVDVVVTTETIAGGVIKTTTTTTTEEVLIDDNSYRDDTQRIYESIWQPIKKWIYKVGTGISELDSLVYTVATYSQFYPMIPIRLDNEFISDKVGWEDIYALAKKSYRKGTDGAKYDSLVSDISSSEDLADMDYIYVVYGVSLNTIDKSARKYIYEFFRRLKIDQIGGDDFGDTYQAALDAYNDAYNDWLIWKNDSASSGVYLPEPELPPIPSLPNNELIIQQLGTTGGTNINYDIRISWNYIKEVDEQIGLGRTGAKKNDLWIEDLGETTVALPIYTGSGSFEDWSGAESNGVTKYSAIRIYWQYSENEYRYLEVTGLVHRNFIYEGKHVTITATDALSDSDESGFIIPLHYATYRELSLKDATQMSTACVYLVFNVYEVKKQKWWQSWFFQVIFVIVVAILSVIFTGGAGIGLLGSHITVGSLFGLSGLSAAIVGSVANALAALVLTTVVSKLVEGLGPLGAIIGALVNILVGGLVTNFQSGLGFSFNLVDLLRPENLLKLTNSVGEAYQLHVKEAITGMQSELVKIQEGINSELKRIQEVYLKQFGAGSGQIDPTMFVGNSPVLSESSDSFLRRTLMTGSDIASMSHSLVNEYVDLMQTLPNAYS
jgi:hypothetical protein